MGIEPTSSAWKAEVLPLNHTRSEYFGTLAKSSLSVEQVQIFRSPDNPLATTWWRGEDSNLRRLSQQIYSLPPLTAREPLRNSQTCDFREILVSRQ